MWANSPVPLHAGMTIQTIVAASEGRAGKWYALIGPSVGLVELNGVRFCGKPWNERGNRLTGGGCAALDVRGPRLNARLPLFLLNAAIPFARFEMASALAIQALFLIELGEKRPLGRSIKQCRIAYGTPRAPSAKADASSQWY